jgi:hypothetical protein
MTRDVERPFRGGAFDLDDPVEQVWMLRKA